MSIASAKNVIALYSNLFAVNSMSRVQFVIRWNAFFSSYTLVFKIFYELSFGFIKKIVCVEVDSFYCSIYGCICNEMLRT